ncbi:hypothetical protein BX281_1516 [Streptomyces sp. Ag82_O1-15]|nr:hypothetical protein BX281_1516 [Streptomyces sp. Ag82_O1-15]
MTGDLERNTKEQERIGVEIEALQEQLRALQHDHTVLVNMQQARHGQCGRGGCIGGGTCTAEDGFQEARCQGVVRV